MNYERALALAQNMASYSSTGEGKKEIRHRVVLSAAEVRDFCALLEIVETWKSAMCLLGDRTMRPRQVRWIANCIRRRVESYDPDEYCHKGSYWGCRQFANYIETGKFTAEGVFQVDKERLRFEVEKRLDRTIACPFLDPDDIMRRLERIPDEIDPRQTDTWDYLWELNRAVGVRFIKERKEVHFTGIEERGEKAWRTRIIMISNDDWLRYATLGHIPEVDELCEQGWYLVNVIPSGDNWFCLLNRIP